MKKLMLNVCLLLCAIFASAQQVEKMPTDPEVRVGKLDNGLTYYIRHNELPKQRCEFHIAQAVGATLEEDNQNGLAHFLEHMCFNGTEHFPGKGIIEYFESVGVNFGGNINAYTSLDQTVYRLSEVPTYREGIIDSALLVMHDWSCAVSLLGEEIDNERGVIREEWRTGATASRRMWKESNRLMYPGSQYAKRDVIGDTAVINNFSYDALRAYYKKWYGPDLQAIVVVGDIDVDQIENKIKALWANVPARVNRGERPIAQIADNKEPIVAVVTDAEAQQTQIKVIFKHQPLPKEYKGTNVDYIQNICHQLIGSMIGERMDEILIKPEAPITGGWMSYFNLYPAIDAFYTTAVAKEGQEKAAYALLLEQIEKARRYGFAEDELERAKTNMLNNYEKAYNERSATRNISYVNEYIGNFIDGDAIPGIEFENNLIKQVLPVINVDALNQIMTNYIREENIIVNIQAPTKPEVNLPTEGEILAGLAAMPTLEIEAPKAEIKDLTLVKKAPKAGKIKKITKNASLGTTEWTLKNGVRVVIKPTEFKKDEIQMQAYSLGGLTQVKQEDLPSAGLATSIISFMGLGNLSMNDLQKALTGKTVDINTYINPNTESLEGASSVKDFETLLQLIYLGFTSPRRDEQAYETLIGLLDNQLKNKDVNPKSAFSDSIQMMQTNNSKRTVLYNSEVLKQVSLDRALAVFKERFANPADFIFIFVGNIDPEDKPTQKLICTWLGGLKTQKSREEIIDHHIRVPEGQVKNYFTRDMQIKTASNRIQYTSYDMPFTLANELNMQMIGRILSTRYLESIREREGGSYGVGTQGYLSAYPVAKAALLMQFDTDPDKQARLMEIIHEEVNTIIENGPLTNDLQKEKESMIKDFSEDLEKNGWWVETIANYYKSGINYVTEYEAAVNAITAETVQQTLRKLVEAGNMFEVVMMPQD
ncbi:MAG: insulinase family protein [Paludibacteraceae bacterium]|nr:insulinase family protein [Paludibacteraceae bacterium]